MRTLLREALVLIAGVGVVACGGSGETGGSGGQASASSAATGGAASSGSGAGGAASTGAGPAGSGATSSSAASSSASSGAGGGQPDPGMPGPNDVVVDLGDVHQTMDGFGAADVWMGALTDAQADMFFDPDKGIGLSFLRVGIDTNGSDLAPTSNIQKAAARGAQVWGAPWTPPAGYKDNNNVNNGGHLLAGSYDAWATTLAGFAAKVKQATGVQLYGVSAQNEPDFTASYASCLYSGAQMNAFVKVLGPKLKALNPPVKLIAAEPDVWGDLWGGQNSYGTAILNDAAAAQDVDILATHQYGTFTAMKPPANVSKHIWETEVSGVMGSPEAGPSADIANGIAVAGWIHDAILNGGASAWHYWWLISLNNDNEGLLLMGGGKTKRLYTMGNFSKFIRPGFARVGVSGPVPAGVQISAYKDPVKNTTVVVAINTNAAATPISLFVSASPWPSAITPWVTSANDDLASKPAIMASGGAHFSASIAGKSVTTFVGAP